ncbi:hypothetical protein D9613_004309 [Agrocybe pediades]|uniref:BCS1 N-terminal domain-containing protein n=1 Tax=Agrocybe pediades TaxID=84607 RepID=A0A8H4QJA7_9AGAR|nr:hypothetical protein D9613_004309 [Agrocybe pediades]
MNLVKLLSKKQSCSARLRPRAELKVVDCGSSTRSSSIEIGDPLCSKCSVAAGSVVWGCLCLTGLSGFYPGYCKGVVGRFSSTNIWFRGKLTTKTRALPEYHGSPSLQVIFVLRLREGYQAVHTHVTEDDFPYDWLMVWLSRCPEWQRSCKFETTTRPSLPGGNSLNKLYGVGGSEEDKDWDLWEAAEVNVNGSSNIWSNADGSDERLKTRVVFQPTCDTTHTIFYCGHWLRVKRKKKLDDLGLEILSISVIAWSNAILKQLVLQAKREYKPKPYTGSRSISQTPTALGDGWIQGTNAPWAASCSTRA